MCRGDKLVAEAVAPLWNKPKNGIKVVKGESCFLDVIWPNYFFFI